MGDEDIIRRLREYIGTGNVQGPYNHTHHPEWTPMWRFALNKQSDVLPLLRELLPLMGARRSSKILELCNTAGVQLQDVAVV